MNGPEKNEKTPLVAIAAVSATILVTFGFVAYRTVQNVSASSGYVVRVDERARPAAPPTTAAPQLAIARTDAGPTVRHAVVRERTRVASSPTPAHSAPPPSAAPSATPKPTPTPARSARPEATPHASATARPHAHARAMKHGTPTDEVAVASVPFERTSVQIGPRNETSASPAKNEVAPPTVAPAPTATPVAVALAPAPSLYAPERIVEARIKNAVQPDYPSDPSLAGTHATTIVLVTIGPSGRVARTAIEKSSGFNEFDRAALAAARLTDYYAPNIDGKPATETYRMVYDFR